MNKEVYDKPLIMADFMTEKGKKKPRTSKSRLYQKVERLPEPKGHKGRSKYSELVSAIAKEKRGTYKVLLDSIKEGLTAKSAYPSIEKLLVEIAKRNDVDFDTALRRQVDTKKGVKTLVSYPQYLRWKEENMRLRVVNKELFIEKKTDKPL